MLTEIKKLLKERESISLYDLSLHFCVEESAMENMMEIFLRKGTAKKADIDCSTGSCGGCVMKTCHPSKMIYYQWI
jgi:hypothetical protein